MNFNDLSLLADTSKSTIFQSVYSRFKPLKEDFELPNVDKLSGLNALNVKIRQAQELSQNAVNTLSIISGPLNDFPEVEWLYPFFNFWPRSISYSGKLVDNAIQFADTAIEAELIDQALDNLIALINKFGYSGDYGKVLTLTSNDGKIFRLINYSRQGTRWVINMVDDGDAHTVIRDFPQHTENECAYELNTLMFPSDYTRLNDVQPSLILTLIKSLSINVSTYDMLADLSLALRSNTQSAISAVMDKYKQIPSLKDAASNFISSFGLGGKKAVLETLSEGLTMAKNADEDADGFLNYTDPAAFMPKDFLSGMAGILITTISAIVATIASAVNPIISACVMIIGTIVSKIVEFVQQNVNFKAYITDGNTSWYPIHCFAKELVCSILPSVRPGSPLYYLLKVGSPIEVIIPGMHQVLSSYRPNTGVIRHEYFIDSVDRTELLFSNRIFDISGNQVTVNYYSMQGFSDEKVFNPVNEGATLSDDDDAHLRLIIALNIFVAAGFYQSATNSFEYSRFRCTGTDIVCDSVYGHSLADFESSRLAGNLGTIALALAYVQEHPDNPTRGLDILTWERIANVVYDLSINNLCLNSDPDHDYPLFGFGSNDGDKIYKLIGEDEVTDPNVSDFVSTQPIYDDLQSCIMPGRYDKTKTIVQAIGLGVATAVIAGVTAYVGVKVSRAIQKQKAMRMAKVESTYTNFYENPTKENYEAYRKAVKSNNRFASFFGGTKFSKVNRWDTVEDVSTKDESTGLISKLSSFTSQYYTPDEITTPSSDVTLAGVLTAIIG